MKTFESTLRAYVRELLHESQKDSEERVDEFCATASGGIVGFTAPMGFVGGRAPKKRKKKKRRNGLTIP